MLTVKRIGVGSAFRVGMVAGAVLAAITSLILLLLQGAFFSFIASAMNATSWNGMTGSGSLSSLAGANNLFTAFGLAVACLLYIVNIVLSAVFGGIAAALAAFAYNVTAGWVGGLEIEVVGSLDKLKRDLDDDLLYR